MGKITIPLIKKTKIIMMMYVYPKNTKIKIT